MNKDVINGSWNEIKGKIKARWAKLTDNDIDELEGNMESLGGKLQRTYGFAKDQADLEYRKFRDSLGSPARDVDRRTDPRQ